MSNSPEAQLVIACYNAFPAPCIYPRSTVFDWIRNRTQTVGPWVEPNVRLQTMEDSGRKALAEKQRMLVYRIRVEPRARDRILLPEPGFVPVPGLLGPDGKPIGGA